MFMFYAVCVPFSAFYALSCFKNLLFELDENINVMGRQVAFLCIKRPVFGQLGESIHIFGIH